MSTGNVIGSQVSCQILFTPRDLSRSFRSSEDLGSQGLHGVIAILIRMVQTSM